MIKEKAKFEMVSYLNEMKRGEIQVNYDEFLRLVLRFKDNFSSKEMLSLLGEVTEENPEFDDYQDEILFDISNRIFGHHQNSLKVEWD